MFVYETRLEHLYDQAIRERDQDKLRNLMDEILRLLAELHEDSRKSH
jgi:hypothetical protein